MNRAYLRRQILPFFAGRPIGEISREDVRAWFRGLHATPAAAHPPPRTGRRTPWLWLDYFWHGVREDAGLQDVRLHDLRHTVASQAVARGVLLSNVGGTGTG